MLKRHRPMLLIALMITGCLSRPAPRPEAPPAPPPADPTPHGIEPWQEPSPPTPPVETAPLAPAAVFDRFREALAGNDVRTAWGLLSRRTQQILGASEAEFGGQMFREMQAAYGGWRTARTSLEQQVDDNLSVVAVTGDRDSAGAIYRHDVTAVALVREDSLWRLALGVGPTLSAAAPIAYEKSPATADRVDVYIMSVAPIGTALLWLDGKQVAAHKGIPGETGTYVGAPLPKPMPAGPHTVVAFATDNQGNPAAMGWSFRLTAPR